MPKSLPQVTDMPNTEASGNISAFIHASHLIILYMRYIDQVTN